MMHVIDNNEDVFVVPGIAFLGADRAVVIMTVLLELIGQHLELETCLLQGKIRTLVC